MPRTKRVKQAKLDTSRGQQNPIGIVNKQRGKDPNASGQNIRTVVDGVRWRNDGRTGEGPVRPKQKPVKQTPTKVKQTPTKGKKVKPAEAEGRYTITKQSAAHTRMKNVTGGTQTQQTQSKGRYRGSRHRGKGVVGRR